MSVSECPSISACVSSGSVPAGTVNCDMNVNVNVDDLIDVLSQNMQQHESTLAILIQQAQQVLSQQQQQQQQQTEKQNDNHVLVISHDAHIHKLQQQNAELTRELETWKKWVAEREPVLSDTWQQRCTQLQTEMDHMKQQYQHEEENRQQKWKHLTSIHTTNVSTLESRCLQLESELSTARHRINELLPHQHTCELLSSRVTRLQHSYNERVVELEQLRQQQSLNEQDMFMNLMTHEKKFYRLKLWIMIAVTSILVFMILDRIGNGTHSMREDHSLW